MNTKLPASAADRSYNEFQLLVRSRKILRFDDPKLTEADTRSKLIDPIFRDVLEWSESEIMREKPVISGFVDYVFGFESAYLLVEAKRTKPRFSMDVSSKARRLKLNGPHLLGQKKMRGHLEQVQRYASDLGAQIAVLTNGSQFVLFRPYIPGRSWNTGIAIAFHDHDDILTNFALFFRLLSREAVVKGELLDAFEEFEGITETLYAPIQNVQNADQEFVRNPYWSKMSRVFAPLLSDQAEDPASQEEIIRNCYVTTNLSDQADKNLDRLLRDIPNRTLQDAGVIDTDSSKRGPFSFQFTQDVENYRPGTYVLTGGVGSGKTTFLRRFALAINPEFINQYCIWNHIDFLTIGNVNPSNLDDEIREHVYKQIRQQVKKQYPDRYPRGGKEIRELFAENLQQARETILYEIPEDSIEWATETGKIVDTLYNSDADFTTALLKRLSNKGLRLVIVLDNTDQQGEDFQERVFLFAQKLSQTHRAFTIVSLREERFFAAYRRGIFDAFGDRRFHIGSPELRWVLKTRLDFGQKQIREAAQDGNISASPAEIHQIDLLLESITHSVTQRNTNIVRMLACVSNGDMRYALDMFRHFLSSGNTYVAKIIEIIEEHGNYTVPFHEFAKSAILGSRRYFQSSSSHIVNVFKKSSAGRASHLAGLRILARLDRAQHSASEHGQGFVKTSKLLSEYRASFGQANDLEESAGTLVQRGLIESEPPKIQTITMATALRISASGSYYWRYLVRAFAYLDLVWIDTPVADHALARRLASLAESTHMTDRFERVRLFLEYLAEREDHELLEVARRSGPYRDPLIPEVGRQIEQEITVISNKLGLKTEARVW